MDDARFDALIRRLGVPITRGDALRGLTAGLLAAATGGALAARETAAKKKKKKKCPAGFLKCTIRRRRKRKKTRCVDAQNDPANCGGCGAACESAQSCCAGACTDTQTDASHCGACGNACVGDTACTAAVCNQGACETTSRPAGVPCAAGTGACDGAGRCVATVCAGKAAANPCFPFDAGTCNTGGSTCRCGSDIDGNVACFEVAACLSVAEGPCASSADCVAKGFPPGSICFSATNCCTSGFGCTTPCPT